MLRPRGLPGYRVADGMLLGRVRLSGGGAREQELAHISGARVVAGATSDVRDVLEILDALFEAQRYRADAPLGARSPPPPLLGPERPYSRQAFLVRAPCGVGHLDAELRRAFRHETRPRNGGRSWTLGDLPR